MRNPFVGKPMHPLETSSSLRSLSATFITTCDILSFYYIFYYLIVFLRVRLILIFLEKAKRKLGKTRKMQNELKN